MADNLDLEQWKCWSNILSANSNVSVTCVKWDDLTNALVGIKTYTKYEEYRFRMTEDFVKRCKKFIENSNVLNFEKCYGIQASAFGLLRNCCVGSKKNQDCIMSCEIPCTAIEILDQILRLDQDSDSVKQVLSSGIQLLGNVVVDHKKNKEIVWKLCFPNFFMKVMRHRYNEVKNCVCMVIYNCIREKLRTELYTTTEGLSLVNDIVKMCCTNETNVEWGIFIIELLIKNGSFQQVYTGLKDNALRLFLLESIEHRLKDNLTPECCVSWISLDNAIFISQTFEDSINKVLNFEKSFDVQKSSSQVILVNSLLRLLCLLTAFEDEYQELRSRKCLFETTLVTLRETSSEENMSFFSNLKRFSNPDDDNSTHPAFGFKRNLIQLIGNMCYLNTLNQDCVRHMDCIPLLLEHCNVDDYNPYICQWAIFCLRNVLENNLENQQVIRSLTKLGLASNTRLAEAGFVVEEMADGKLRVVGKPNKESS